MSHPLTLPRPGTRLTLPAPGTADAPITGPITGLFAGLSTTPEGQLYALILLPDLPAGPVTWRAATDWAASIGASLPTRPESALLYAGLQHLGPTPIARKWHWTSETCDWDASFAWLCYFRYGDTGFTRKSFEGSAVAVRRWVLQSFDALTALCASPTAEEHAALPQPASLAA